LVNEIDLECIAEQ